MHRLRTGWAFFVLAILLMIVALLTVGVFVGTETNVKFARDGRMFFSKDCRYLYLSGFRDVWNRGGVGAYKDTEDERGFCPVLGILAN